MILGDDYGKIKRLAAQFDNCASLPNVCSDRESIFTAHLQAGDNRCILKLPASDAQLEIAKKTLRVDDFWEKDI